MVASRRTKIVAFCALPLLSACAELGLCRSTECSDDARLRNQVRAQINHTGTLGIFNIDVQTHAHSVYLWGIVDTEIDRGMAEQVALAVPGVTRVYDGLVLSGNPGH
jgi:osmotically-inducible protein OsmY